ncbi:MAG: undecaprenyldiphospho-muramoylpentapeptide beta-N-acetylglucosaminyltransferase [Pseudomonadales bacterium]|nr:undecaprenyldiphospho-muramoylpentapeptide beta-N-acetylglucosaminyltransferase [Pseudomonadales bacterium]
MTDIVFTGGGSAGHVTPNIAIIDRLTGEGWRTAYIGSRDGIERALIEELRVPYYPIASGKLRRYFSWQNFTDPFRILFGVLQSLAILLRLRPKVVFSKGGFVSVPVVFAAWLCRIPVIGHESDITPGLANRLAFPFVRRICVNFDETVQYLPPGKTVVTGSPVRESLLSGDRQAGLTMFGLSGDKPVLLVFGGSLGATSINQAVRGALDALPDFDVIHVTGAGLESAELSNRPGYVQRAFIGQGFGDVLAAADVVLSRAGANSLYELLAARKPHVLVPLPLSASRGDQIDNARVFEAAGMSRVIPQEKLTPESLAEAVREVYEDRAAISAKLATFERKDAVTLITGLIKDLAVGRPG